jgi:hypothetical protein
MDEQKLIEWLNEKIKFLNSKIAVLDPEFGAMVANQIGAYEDVLNYLEEQKGVENDTDTRS